MVLLDRVRQFVRQHDLIRSDTRVVAAVSGGSDSVALVQILHELEAAGELRLAGLAHFNHQLRHAAADDEQFCRALAQALGRPILVDRGDVGERARREHRSLEGAARASRYEFFDRARAHFDADVVALGHTRDDQAETFMLRLVRGAGPRGLAGMYPRHGPVVRPLLSCRRDELRAWLARRQPPGERRPSYVEDETNRDVSIPRNRVRAELLPLVATRFNPEIVDVLAEEADLAREIWAWMEASADQLASAARLAPLDAAPARAEFDAAVLMAAPPALARVVLWRAMNHLGAGRVGYEHVSAVLDLARGDRDGSLDLPRQQVQRIGGRLVLIGRPAGAGRWTLSRANLFRHPLSIPGEVELPEAACVISAEVGVAAPSERCAIVGNGPVAAVRRDLCRGSLAVRNRRPGDRFRPIGLNGRKKLQDFFVDRRVARHERDGVPIVVDGADRIVWVAGYGIDEAFQVTEPAQAVLLLRLRQA
jgi:tRNA(Ile)-lysidine synthase